MITITSLKEAKTQIHNYNYVFSCLPEDEENIKIDYPKEKHYRFSVWDVEHQPIILNRTQENYMPSYNNISIAIDIFKRIKLLNFKDIKVLFHCYYGTSRSPAFAQLFLEVLGYSQKDSEKIVRDNSYGIIHPNTLILSIGRNIIREEKNGKN